MILAIIFLITDLFMVGIAYAVYGRTAVAGYSDGRFLEYIYDVRSRKIQCL